MPSPPDAGDPKGPDRKPTLAPGAELEAALYDHLRALARRLMGGERVGHTLTATALVHEAYVRLAPAGLEREERARFLHVAGLAMRRVLVDHARRRGAAKRGGRESRRRLTEIRDVVDLSSDVDLEDVLALEEALVRLERADARAAAVVRLRFYAGVSGEEAAEVLGISPRQADRDWAYARAFLLSQLAGREGGPSR